MIEILQNGRDKVFYSRCPKCGTEFHYQLDDVKEDNKQVLPSAFLYPYIDCPVCGNKITATLMTEEETKSNFVYPITYIPYGTIGGCNI